MPRVFRVLSGQEVVRILEELGFVFKSQAGSHIELSFSIENKIYTAVVPNHKILKQGTLIGIYKQVSAISGIDCGELNKRFKN